MSRADRARGVVAAGQRAPATDHVDDAQQIAALVADRPLAQTHHHVRDRPLDDVLVIVAREARILVASDRQRLRAMDLESVRGESFMDLLGPAR